MGVDPQNQFASGFVGMGNNPVVMVDPDGEWVHIVVGAILGGITNVARNWDEATDSPWGWFKTWEKGAFVGAVAAFTGGATAGAITGGTAAVGVGAGSAAGAAGGAVGGFVGGAGNAWINGASFDDGLVAGFKAGGYGALTGGVIGGISGGITAYRQGRNPVTGNFTEKSVSRFASKIGVDLSSEELGYIMRNRDGLDLDSYFNDLPGGTVEAKPIVWSEVVDDEGAGWWDHFWEDNPNAYYNKFTGTIQFRATGAIQPVYPETYLMGGTGGLKALKAATKFRRIAGGFLTKNPALRVQLHKHFISPISGRGFNGAMRATHFNINKFHIIMNPKRWRALSNNPYLPFRY